MLGVFVIARITGVLEVEAFAMYGALITCYYLLFGGALLRAVWFPLRLSRVHIAATGHGGCRSHTSRSRSRFLSGPSRCSACSVTRSRARASTIQIGQYQLLVAAACAGLNSIVTLGALCLFYVYLRHRSDPLAFLIIAVAAIPVAIISNFVGSWRSFLSLIISATPQRRASFTISRG